MFAALLERLALALDEASLPYMIIGGQAVLLHGEPRLTRDIDITLGVDLNRLDDLLRVVASLALEPLVDPEDFTRKTLVLPCKDAESGIRVDFIFSWSNYERSAIGRSVAVAQGKAQVRFASAEDLIVHKVIAGRPRDLEDVRSVLVKNPGVDRDFVAQTLAEFDVSLGEDYRERWNQILQD